MAKGATTDSTKIELAQFAQMLGGTEEEARMLSRKGILPKIRDGKIPLVEGIQKMAQHLRNPEVSAIEAAAVIDVSPQWIRDLLAQGFLQKLPNGRLRREDVPLGYIRWLKDEGRRNSKTASASKVQEARAKQIGLVIAQKERELVPVEDAQSAMSDLCGMIRQAFQGIGARITRDLTLRKSIDKEVNEALDRISDGAQERGQALAAGGEALEAGPDGPAGQVGDEE